MLILKYNNFLEGDDRLVFDFFVIVDPLLGLKGRLCRYQRAVVAVYLAIGDALPPNISINIGDLMIRYSSTVATPGLVCGRLSFDGCVAIVIDGSMFLTIAWASWR